MRWNSSSRKALTCFCLRAFNDWVSLVTHGDSMDQRPQVKSPYQTLGLVRSRVMIWYQTYDSEHKPKISRG